LSRNSTGAGQPTKFNAPSFVTTENLMGSATAMLNPESEYIPEYDGKVRNSEMGHALANVRERHSWHCTAFVSSWIIFPLVCWSSTWVQKFLSSRFSLPILKKCFLFALASGVLPLVFDHPL
jgi:hypothetical protein